MKKMETSNFKRLIGIWKTEGTVNGEKGNLRLTGIDSYEYMLDGNFILHKADVMMGDEKSETFEIISAGDSKDTALMQYYNSKGESGVMNASLSASEFKITGEKIKFEGTIDDENSKLTGNWFMQTDDGAWVAFIDLQLTKLS